MGKNFVSLFTLIQEVCFQSLVSCGLAGLPMNQVSAELNGKGDESESYLSILFRLFTFLVSA